MISHHRANDLTIAKQELSVTKEKCKVLQEESKKAAMKLATTSNTIADTKAALKTVRRQRLIIPVKLHKIQRKQMMSSLRNSLM